MTKKELCAYSQLRGAVYSAIADIEYYCDDYDVKGPRRIAENLQKALDHCAKEIKVI